MIVSVHIPKCAGTSFRLLLDRIYGTEIWHNYGIIFSREQARPELVPPGTKMIHGHFLADAFDEMLPKRRLLTWVRHPVERLVSNYHHFLRAPDMRDDCCRILHEKKLGLREFADLDWMRNMATRYLAGKPVEDFEFIGIAERFEKSMDLFCRTFGIEDSLAFPRTNTNPDRHTDRYELSPADYSYIMVRNADDLAWYHRASRRLSSSKASSSIRVA